MLHPCIPSYQLSVWLIIDASTSPERLIVTVRTESSLSVLSNSTDSVDFSDDDDDDNDDATNSSTVLSYHSYLRVMISSLTLYPSNQIGDSLLFDDNTSSLTSSRGIVQAVPSKLLFDSMIILTATAFNRWCRRLGYDCINRRTANFFY